MMKPTVKIFEHCSVLPDEIDEKNEHSLENSSIIKENTLEHNDYALIKQLGDSLSITYEGNKIKKIFAKQHIGVVSFANFRIAVRPKISVNDKNLPKLIGYVHCFEKIKIIDKSKIGFEEEWGEHLLYVIVKSFVLECRKLLQQGLMKSYVTHHDDVRFLRGKLLIKQQLINIAKNNMYFSCEFDELEHNILENQILLFTLEKCSKMKDYIGLENEIRNLRYEISQFVDNKKINMEDFKKIHYTLLNKHYKNIHDLCKLIIQSMGISNFYDPNKPLSFSFLIDMNVIFEKFVTRLFEENYADHELTCKSQKTEKAWDRDTEDKKNMRTDLLIKKLEEVKDVIDIKYKKKLASGDLYQIAFYIHEHKLEKGYAILPKENGSKEDDQYTSTTCKIIVNVIYLDIDWMINAVYSDRHEDIATKLRDIVPK